MANNGVMQYFAKIGLDAQEFLNGMVKAQGSVLSFYRDVSVSMAATMLVFDKVMQYGQKFVNLANQASQFVSTLDKISATTGMNATELQRWSNVARYADSDISTLASSVNKLQINLAAQGEAGDDARAILDQMGVTYKNIDGSLRSTNELFPEVIEGIQNLSSSSDRVTAANKLFGRSYESLAGYMIMSRDEMEGYYESANVLTDEQQDKLRDYERSVKDLDATMQTLNHTVGTDLTGSFAEWSDLLDSAAQNGGTIDVFFKNLDGFLTAAARGFHIIGQEAKASMQIISLDFEGAKTTIADLASWVQAEQTQDALALSGYFDGAVWDATMQKWVKSTEDASKKVKLNLGDVKNELEVTVKAPKATSRKDMWDPSAVVGANGSEMYSFLMNEMNAGTDYQTALQKWMQGAPTRLDMEGTLGAEGATESDKITEDLDNQLKAYESKYAQIEQVNLKHWTAMGETSRLTMQNMGKWWETEVNWISSKIAYAQTITMTDGKANAAPIDFEKVTAPMLGKTDYSGISFLGGGSEKTGAGSSAAPLKGSLEITVKKEEGTEVTSILSQGI